MRQRVAHHQGMHSLLSLVSLIVLAPDVAATYNIMRNDNLAVYWGQNAGGGQTNISNYCQDTTINNVIVSFLDIFDGVGSEPEINLANICSAGGSYFAGTQLLNCSFMAPQIKACQMKGKIVTLSLGGAIGQVGFSSDATARAFADKVWDSFLDGTDSGQPRPFGDAVLDGVDLDIEQGAPTGYATFVNQIRERAEGCEKRIYITAAPQCPFPDVNIGQALNNASFDAIHVQFYNNYCGLNNPKSYNFATWDQWAKTTSANRDFKIYIGALAAHDGTGYVNAGTLAGYIKEAQETWSSFGGVMLWEASLAVANDDYHQAVKTSLTVCGETRRHIKSRFFHNDPDDIDTKP